MAVIIWRMDHRKARVGSWDPKATGQENIGLATVVTADISSVYTHFCVVSWDQGLQNLGGQREVAAMGKTEPLGADFEPLDQASGREWGQLLNMWKCFWLLTVTQWLRKLLGYTKLCKG